MNRKIMLAAALIGTAASAQVHSQSHTIQSEVHISGSAGGAGGAMTWVGEGGPGSPATMHFIAAGNLDGKVVKNAPYSAEATTETTRTLADGTRIVSKHTTIMARDKDGRTRRESNFGNSGPFQGMGDTLPRLVTITDPVAKEVYILNYNDKTARKVKMGEPMMFRTEKKDGNRSEIHEERVQVMMRKIGGDATSGDVVFHGPPMGAVSAVRVPFDSKNAKSEKLAPQTMEGVQVEGTRSTNTIPAGTIGNDRAIVSTSESWYSNELQMLIYSRSNDPQVGETVYRVSNLRRAEPDASQFKVPSDFKLVENPPSGQMMFNRKIEAREP